MSTVSTLNERFADLRASYSDSGIGARVGFGATPAVIVIDLTYGFTDPASRLSADLDAEIERTSKILAAARAQGVLRIFLTIGFLPDGSDGGPFMAKCPSLADLVLGTKWTEIDERLGRRDDEPLLLKKAASGFIGTSLDQLLKSRGVDTVLIAGTTTSGCVRATAVDACSYGYRTAVIGDAVGDRSQERHWASLFDLDSKYADVIDTAEAVAYLSSPGAGAAERSHPDPSGGHVAGTRRGARRQPASR